MSLYTERHGMRKPIKRTTIISIEMYALLLDCCERYYEYIAWRFSEQCPDGNGICGVDYEKFRNELQFEIPTIFRNSADNIDKPTKNWNGDCDEYDQYALLDLIELIAQNMKDIPHRSWHSFFRHDDLSFAETSDVFDEFLVEINAIFQKTGLLFILTPQKIIERVVDDNVVAQVDEMNISAIPDKGTRELLHEAISLFKNPHPEVHQKAVEKIWDTLESIKTHFPGIEKNQFDEKFATILSNGDDRIKSIFKNELSQLGNIGNNFRIRHFNATQVVSADERHYDYFFNRCLSLIALAIQYLK